MLKSGCVKLAGDIYIPSELSACDFTDATLCYFENLSFNREDVFAAFAFLRVGGNYEVTSDYLTVKFGRGWIRVVCWIRYPYTLTPLKIVFSINTRSL